MRLSIVVVVLVAAAGCGKQIGDSCIVSSDCSPNGDRLCDTTQKDGYCTVQGCDYNTCPDNAVCVRFFMGSLTNTMCDPTTEGISTHDCNLDEVCTLQGMCTPRIAEVRYCMASCSSNGDCRSGYECRTYQKMIDHGGEPVLAPGTPLDKQTAPKFCAQAP